VSSFELANLALQYNARLKELRELGFPIVSRTERQDGAVRGFFRLQSGFHGAVNKPDEIPQPQPAGTLFDLNPSPD
jgi:hypothetical protein